MTIEAEKKIGNRIEYDFELTATGKLILRPPYLKGFTAKRLTEIKKEEIRRFYEDNIQGYKTLTPKRQEKEIEALYTKALSPLIAQIPGDTRIAVETGAWEDKGISFPHSQDVLYCIACQYFNRRDFSPEAVATRVLERTINAGESKSEVDTLVQPLTEILLSSYWPDNEFSPEE